MLRKNYWHIELNDGRVFAFYLKREKGHNPLEENRSFHHPNGTQYIMDITELRETEEYPIYEEENSFVLIPKKDIKRVFYVN